MLLSFFTTTATFKTQPTELFFFLQQDEAERRVSQDELSDGGQAHDASSHHGHVIRAKDRRQARSQTVQI